MPDLDRELMAENPKHAFAAAVPSGPWTEREQWVHPLFLHMGSETFREVYR